MYYKKQLLCNAGAVFYSFGEPFVRHHPKASVLQGNEPLQHRKCHIDCIIYAFSHFNIAKRFGQEEKMLYTNYK